MLLPEISNLFFIKINPRLQNPLFGVNHILAPASCLWLLGDNLLAYYRYTSFQLSQVLHSFHTLINKNTKVYLLHLVRIPIRHTVNSSVYTAINSINPYILYILLYN